MVGCIPDFITLILTPILTYGVCQSTVHIIYVIYDIYDISDMYGALTYTICMYVYIGVRFGTFLGFFTGYFLSRFETFSVLIFVLSITL